MQATFKKKEFLLTVVMEIGIKVLKNLLLTDICLITAMGNQMSNLNQGMGGMSLNQPAAGGMMGGQSRMMGAQGMGQYRSGLHFQS